MERLQRLPLNGKSSSCMVAADHAGSPTIQAATGHSASSLRQLKVAS